MLRQLFALVICSFLIFMSGCANMKNSENAQHYRKDFSAADSSEIFKDTPLGMSKVYLLMSDTPAGWAVNAIPPRAVILGKTVVSFMPYPSHIVLILPPGVYSFKNLQKVRLISGSSWRARIDTKITLEPNRVHVYEQRWGVFGDELVELTESAGNKIIKDYPLAKVVHAPYYMAETIPNHFDLSASPVPPKATPKDDLRVSNTSNEIISSEALSDFFAVAGAIALFALIIFSASAVAPIYMPPPSPSMPPAIHMNAVKSQPISVRSASGRVMNFENQKDSGSILNLSTGVRYRMEGENISGTDGSRYRSAGSAIFSNTGNSYTKSGNAIYSNDGRSCQIIGSLIDCK